MKLPKVLLFFATILQATLLLIACGDSKVSGTDEQTNSVTAALDSALAEWTVDNTLTVPERQEDPCLNCLNYELPIHHLGIQAKNGTLYNVVRNDFESLTCETETTWFVYSVNAGDSLIRKALVLPDSLSADGFESDCASEGGLFKADTTSNTKGQHAHTCDLETAAYLTGTENRLYIDPNWKKYVELIVGICRD